MLGALTVADAVFRDDLVGVLGEGSGRFDGMIFRAGDWCLKTARRRCFLTREQGEQALAELIARKQALGPLLPPDTVLFLCADNEGFWLWTVAPWFPTLRGLLSQAVARRDEAAVAAALVGFAEAVVAAVKLAVHEHLVLDVHPSNFGISPTGLCYLDDDIDPGQQLLSIAHAMLQRVNEYGEWPHALATYLGAFEEFFATQLSASEVKAAGLATALAEAIPRGKSAEAARERWRHAALRCG